MQLAGVKCCYRTPGKRGRRPRVRTEDQPVVKAATPLCETNGVPKDDHAIEDVLSLLTPDLSTEFILTSANDKANLEETDFFQGSDSNSESYWRDLLGPDYHEGGNAQRASSLVDAVSEAGGPKSAETMHSYPTPAGESGLSPLTPDDFSPRLYDCPPPLFCSNMYHIPDGGKHTPPYQEISTTSPCRHLKYSGSSDGASKITRTKSTASCKTDSSDMTLGLETALRDTSKTDAFARVFSLKYDDVQGWELNEESWVDVDDFMDPDLEFPGKEEKQPAGSRETRKPPMLDLSLSKSEQKAEIFGSRVPTASRQGVLGQGIEGTSQEEADPPACCRKHGSEGFQVAMRDFKRRFPEGGCLSNKERFQILGTLSRDNNAAALWNELDTEDMRMLFIQDTLTNRGKQT
ncbi:hypothetical protein C8035_v004417 [Colletotrichum spinosum]|uniref:Uncharacterized protein n=1 Tax=Colletotrichum spinosum TaxID=1347390 RepID=A0A4R8PRG0_9PEZI|nr:hypothetical protein C8035_v004417 [Colletotrichum spinosum]